MQLSKSTLLAKLSDLSGWKDDSEVGQIARQRGEKLRNAHPVAYTSEGGVTTRWHEVYNTAMEYNLCAGRIDIGALVSLDVTENPTLRDMKEAYGDKIALSWLLPHVAALNAASGASNRMDREAVQLCCMDILCGFPTISLGEFCTFCHGMRTLKYVARRSDYVFSSDTIMQGLREFMKERNDAIAAYDRKNKRPVFHGDEITLAEWQALKARKQHATIPEERLPEGQARP